MLTQMSSDKISNGEWIPLIASSFGDYWYSPREQLVYCVYSYTDDTAFIRETISKQTIVEVTSSNSYVYSDFHLPQDLFIAITRVEVDRAIQDMLTLETNQTQ